MSRCRLFFYLAVLILAPAATGEAGPYTNGRLREPAFVELAGSAKQIEAIEHFAKARHWRVDCEGAQGPFRTLRLRFPAGTTQKSIESYFDTDLRLPMRAFKISMIYEASRRSSTCVTLP